MVSSTKSVLSYRNDEMDIFERAVINLIDSKQGFFYAAIILQMKRIPMKMERGAMGVGFENGQVRLVYDPDWLNKMTVQQVMFCLEHEVIHIVLDHLERLGDRDPQLWNLAADLAVNGYILDDPGLVKEPYEIVKPGAPGMFADMPKGKTAEWYFDLINQKVDKYSIQFNKDGTVTVTNKKTGESHTFKPNSHDDWESMNKGDVSLNREKMKEMVKEAYNEAKSRGFQPGSAISELIEELLKDSKLNWRMMLRQCVAASILSRDSKTSWKRTSRRYGDDYAGHIRVRMPKITVSLDTSGSVSDQDLEECINELGCIQKIYGAKITIIECDAAIGKVYDLTKYKKIDRNVTGRGGTSHRPVVDYINEHPTDLWIGFTDLCSDLDVNYKPKCKTIFVVPSTMGGGTPTAPYGLVVPIPPKDK